MTDEQFKALMVVGALLTVVSGGGGFTAGRATAPAPPVVTAPAPEIQYRIVEVPVPVPVLPGKTTERLDQETFVPPKLGDEAPHAQPAVVPARKSSPAKAQPKSEKKSEVRKPRTPAPKKKGPTAAQCAQLRLGIATVGRDSVIDGGRKRGYTSTQVNWALRECGL